MKIRCSQLGRLMGGFERPKAPLSEEAKSYIEELFIEQEYGRKPIIGSKEMIKGTRVEEQSISLLSEVTNTLYLKSRKEYQNDILVGHIDVMDDTYVIDVKSPYNLWTYTHADLSSVYAWQLMGYMWLTGRNLAKLAYCLVDAPEDMIMDEFRRACFARNVDNLADGAELKEIEEQVRKNMTYGDIPKEKRVKLFEVAYSEEKIQLIKDKYQLALDYYNLLKNT